MPNWCENRLEVRGPVAEVDRFLETCVQKDRYGELYVDFGKTVPEPLGKVAPKPKGLQLDASWGRVEWRYEHWGTKSFGCEATVERDEDEKAVLHFLTAWSPPVPWLERTAQLFPALSFTLHFFEPGVGFAGVAKYAEGKFVNGATYEAGKQPQYYAIASMFGYTNELQSWLSAKDPHGCTESSRLPGENEALSALAYLFFSYAAYMAASGYVPEGDSPGDLMTKATGFILDIHGLRDRHFLAELTFIGLMEARRFLYILDRLHRNQNAYEAVVAGAREALQLLNAMPPRVKPSRGQFVRAATALAHGLGDVPWRAADVIREALAEALLTSEA